MSTGTTKGWIAVDLDGTLAHYDSWPADGGIGAPIPAMVERVKGWLADGRDVRIFTARVYPLGTSEAVEVSTIPDDPDDLSSGGYQVVRTPRAIQAVLQLRSIEAWCKQHLGQVLPVTCIKDFMMVQLWDDRAIQVVKNTGERVG